MSIVYPLSLPSGIRFLSYSPTMNDTTAVMPSPFTRLEQVIVWPAQWWSIVLTAVPMMPDEYEPWVAFLAKLKGHRGTCLLGDPSRAAPRGSAADAPGTPLVRGADQTGDTLDIDGCPNYAEGYLLAGDYIQLGSGSTSRLHKVLDDVDANGSGHATLTLWPDLRETPADNAVVIVNDAKGTFRRDNNSQSWKIEGSGINTELTVTMAEALRP